MNWETVRCYGDSITFGARTYLGYPEISAYHLSQKTNKFWNIQNISVSGYTTIDLLRHLDKDTSNQNINSRPEVVSILIGTNDIKIGTNVKEFTIVYELLLGKLKVYFPNSFLISMSIPEFSKGVMLPYKYGMNKLVRKYNLIIQELSTKYGFEFLTVDSSPNLFVDGVHLNDDGNNKFANDLAGLICKYRDE